MGAGDKHGDDGQEGGEKAQDWGLEQLWVREGSSGGGEGWGEQVGESHSTWDSSSAMPAGHPEVTGSEQLDIQLWVLGSRAWGEKWDVIYGNQVALIWD